MANDPKYDAATARADKMLEPDGSITTHSGTIVSGPSAAGAAAYSSAAARADKLLEPDGSITTSGTGSGGGGTPGGATGQVQYNNAGAFAGAASINTDGTRVGVGTATPSAGLLEVGTYNASAQNIKSGSLYIQPNALNSDIIADNSYYNGTSWVRGATGYTNAIQFNAGQILFFANPSGAAGTFSPYIVMKINYSNGQTIIGGNQSPTFGAAVGAGLTIQAAGSSVNLISISGSGSGVGPVVSAVGNDTNINLALNAKGTGVVQCGNIITTPIYTVATLPAATAGNQGARALVTDATAPTFLGTLTGGGSVITPVFSTGSAWLAG